MDKTKAMEEKQMTDYRDCLFAIIRREYKDPEIANRIIANCFYILPAFDNCTDALDKKCNEASGNAYRNIALQSYFLQKIVMVINKTIQFVLSGNYCNVRDYQSLLANINIQKEEEKIMEEKIRAYIKEAMRSKDKDCQITYKNILETAQKTAKKTNAAVTDEMIVTAIKNEMKQLNELMEYVPESDTERRNVINKKLHACKEVLPKMASEEELLAYLTHIQPEKNMGACMKALKTQFGTNMDGKIASIVAKMYISS